jgi:hypothetical protein
MSFLLGSIYFFIKYLKSFNSNAYIYSLIFASLSVLSNFTFLYFFISLIIAYNFYPIIEKYIRGDDIKLSLKKLIIHNKASIIVFGLLGLIIWQPIKKLIYYKKLYYGGVEGFWVDTIRSLIEVSFYGVTHNQYLVYFIEFIILFILLFSIFLVIRIIFKKEEKLFIESMLLIVTLFIFITMAIISIINHHLLSSKFLIDKTALIFLPTFFLIIIYFFNNLMRTIFKKFSMVCFYLAAIVVVIYFFIRVLIFKSFCV